MHCLIEFSEPLTSSVDILYSMIFLIARATVRPKRQAIEECFHLNMTSIVLPGESLPSQEITFSDVFASLLSVSSHVKYTATSNFEDTHTGRLESYGTNNANRSHGWSIDRCRWKYQFDRKVLRSNGVVHNQCAQIAEDLRRILDDEGQCRERSLSRSFRRRTLIR